MKRSKVILCILDGWGHSKSRKYNAVYAAQPLEWRSLCKHNPYGLLQCSGEVVGLPAGQMGDSEVGHLHLGSGKIVKQPLEIINDEFNSGNFDCLADVVNKLKTTGGCCHLLGLLSSGGVHSHSNHFLLIAKFLLSLEIQVVIHSICDGRDTLPYGGISELEDMKTLLQSSNSSIIGTVMGRYYGMDRDKKWDRTKLAWQAMQPDYSVKYSDPVSYVKDHHRRGIGSEFVLPGQHGKYVGIQEQDVILCLNFRADRIRQLLLALLFPNKYCGYEGDKQKLTICGFSDYGDDLKSHITSVFPIEVVNNTLGEVVSAHKLKQLRIAETEKVPHVTYFFNGWRFMPWKNEDHLFVDSPKVHSYADTPGMSAVELTMAAINKMYDYDFVVINYANLDMVGHTGDFQATISAVQVVDDCLGRILRFAKKNHYVVVVTADHGNAECMFDSEAVCVHTHHTTNLVPIVIYNLPVLKILPNFVGTLCHIAPTILDIMQLPIPRDMCDSLLSYDKI